MLSLKDYNNYLEQILKVEIEMADVYEKCVNVTADEDVKRVCYTLMNQEKNHAKLVRELIQLFAVSA